MLPRSPAMENYAVKDVLFSTLAAARLPVRFSRDRSRHSLDSCKVLINAETVHMGTSRYLPRFRSQSHERVFGETLIALATENNRINFHFAC